MDVDDILNSDSSDDDASNCSSGADSPPVGLYNRRSSLKPKFSKAVIQACGLEDSDEEISLDDLTDLVNQKAHEEWEAEQARLRAEEEESPYDELARMWKKTSSFRMGKKLTPSGKEFGERNGNPGTHPRSGEDCSDVENALASRQKTNILALAARARYRTGTKSAVCKDGIETTSGRDGEENDAPVRQGRDRSSLRSRTADGHLASQKMTESDEGMSSWIRKQYGKAGPSNSGAEHSEFGNSPRIRVRRGSSLSLMDSEQGLDNFGNSPRSVAALHADLNIGNHHRIRARRATTMSMLNEGQGPDGLRNSLRRSDAAAEHGDSELGGHNQIRARGGSKINLSNSESRPDRNRSSSHNGAMLQATNGYVESEIGIRRGLRERRGSMANLIGAEKTPDKLRNSKHTETLDQVPFHAGERNLLHKQISELQLQSAMDRPFSPAASELSFRSDRESWPMESHGPGGKGILRKARLSVRSQADVRRMMYRNTTFNDLQEDDIEAFSPRKESAKLKQFASENGNPLMYDVAAQQKMIKSRSEPMMRSKSVEPGELNIGGDFRAESLSWRKATEDVDSDFEFGARRKNGKPAGFGGLELPPVLSSSNAKSQLTPMQRAMLQRNRPTSGSLEAPHSGTSKSQGKAFSKLQTGTGRARRATFAILN